MAKPPRRPPPQKRRSGLVDHKVESRAVVPRKRDPRQAGLLDAPLPEWIEPCLPTLVDHPPAGPQWVHEIKWDGYRVSCYLQAGAVTIRTRRGHDWTARFPAIAEAAAALRARSAVVDGEAVVLDETGRSSFGRLQAALGATGKQQGSLAADVAILYAFDLLFLDGEDVRPRPLEERRAALARLLGPVKTGAILFSEEVDVEGAVFFRHACEHELEGIVSKRLGTPYRSGRRNEWLKTKCVQSDSFVVIGYQPSEAVPGALGKLRVATMRDGKLVYAGGVGTGFTAAAARDLKRRLDAMKIAKPAVRGLLRKGAVWTRPELVVDVEYRGWTDADQLLRHASFKGVRDDADR